VRVFDQLRAWGQLLTAALLHNREVPIEVKFFRIGRASLLCQRLGALRSQINLACLLVRGGIRTLLPTYRLLNPGIVS